MVPAPFKTFREDPPPEASQVEERRIIEKYVRKRWGARSNVYGVSGGRGVASFVSFNLQDGS